MEREISASFDLREDTDQGQEDAHGGFIGYDPATRKGRKEDHTAGLRVTDDRTLDSSSQDDDVELRKIDHRSQKTAQSDQDPDVDRGLVQCGDLVRPGYGIEEQDGAEGSLVVKQLKAIDLVFPLVCAHPDSVDAADEDTNESHHRANGPIILDDSSSERRGLDIVVGDQGDTETHGNERVGCHPRDRLPVNEEVEYSHTGCQKDPGDLVECDGGDLQREIHADNVHGH